MSTNPDNLLSLERNQLKYLFLATYFDLADTQRLADETKPFIREFVLNNFRVINDDTLLKYLDYLHEIRLKHLVTDRSPNVFKYIKPQFKFICTRHHLSIMKISRGVFLKPNTTIYATNFFVTDDREFSVVMYKLFTGVFKNNRQFINNEMRHVVLGGQDGYVFAPAYIDWSGHQMCQVDNYHANRTFPYRLYLIGEQMAQLFIKENIMFADEPNKRFLLKNFHKGLPMYKCNFEIINSRNFVTRKPNELFDQMQLELNKYSPYIKFIQRDYIYDADFNDDLLELLNEHMTYTSVCKHIETFSDGKELKVNETEIVFDRVSIDRYRKMIIRLYDKTIYPRDISPAYLFVRPEIIQIKDVPNAFYAPKERFLGIIPNNLLFGAKETIDFDFKNLVPYQQSAPPIRVEQLYLIAKKQKIFISSHKFINGSSVYLLIRGDYESISDIKLLKDLTPLVQNAVFQLVINEILKLNQ
ncbi:ORF11 [Leucania separata nucleopolyhedrovirus]|uniref:ORF11 n=1 Tax=Leucania separata nucleopolyhedrovirus TaxID=1307956 RepID=Q0ILA8_NPVLS|nr:ORF11 [Leucania separata nucleopolyhedrovirus]AAR28775.1 ORF11 [Leucania separata nucleopolyhedrovirus]